MGTLAIPFIFNVTTIRVEMDTFPLQLSPAGRDSDGRAGTHSLRVTPRILDGNGMPVTGADLLAVPEPNAGWMLLGAMLAVTLAVHR